MKSPDDDSRLNSTAANPQTASEASMSRHLSRSHRNESFSSDLSVTTEDDTLYTEGSKAPSPNSLNANRSLASGRWVESPLSSASSPSGRQQNQIVDRPSHFHVLNLIDRTMDELQRVPSEEESSCGSAVFRVKQAVRQTHLLHGDDGEDTPRQTPLAPSLSDQRDTHTLAELKLARDLAVAEIFEKKKVVHERRARMIDIVRALMLSGIYFGLLRSCYCCFDLEFKLVPRELWALPLVEAAGAWILCYLSTVPTEARKPGETVRLMHILLSRKTMLLCSYLLVWACIWDAGASLRKPVDQCTALSEARRQVQTRSHTPEGPSLILPIVSSVEPARWIDLPMGLEKNVCEISKELVEDATLANSDVQERRDDMAGRVPPTKILSLPAFLPRPGGDEKLHREFASDDPPIVRSHHASVSGASLSFGEFRTSALSTKLEEDNREKEELDTVTLHSRKVLLSRLQVVMNAAKLMIGPLLGFHGHDNKSLMETIVEVWASSK